MKIAALKKMCPSPELQKRLLGSPDIVDFNELLLGANIADLPVAERETYTKSYLECLQKQSESEDKKVAAKLIKYFVIQSEGFRQTLPSETQKLLDQTAKMYDVALKQTTKSVSQKKHPLSSFKKLAKQNAKISRILEDNKRLTLLDKEIIQTCRRNVVKGDQPFSYDRNHEVILPDCQPMMLVPAPSKNTVLSYFKMVFEKKAPLLVTLCSPKESAEIVPFWKERTLKELSTEGNWSFKLLKKHVHYEGDQESSKERIKVTERTLALSNGSEEHIVTHLHYKNWPDRQSAPDYEALEKVFSLRDKLAKDPNKPIVINCRHGVGRTAMFAVIDASRQMIEAAESRGTKLDDIDVNPASLLLTMRRFRPSLEVVPAQMALPYEMIGRFYDAKKNLYRS